METLFRVQVPLVMRFRVAALDAVASTPAGDFERCLLLEGQGQADSDPATASAPRTLEATTRGAACAGRRPVRRERH
ncbi:MAG: hypothetical protein IPM80_18010 [Proteobacteria bacterium]|nr:hypothetical protein [Pseudomonadota bacterium]